MNKTDKLLVLAAFAILGYLNRGFLNLAEIHFGLISSALAIIILFCFIGIFWRSE
jgi:hypothetical protein